MRALFFFTALIALAFVSAEAFSPPEKPSGQIVVIASDCGPEGCDNVSAKLSCEQNFLTGNIIANGQGREKVSQAFNRNIETCGCDEAVFAQLSQSIEKAAEGKSGRENFDGFSIEYTGTRPGNYVVTMRYGE